MITTLLSLWLGAAYAQIPPREAEIQTDEQNTLVLSDFSGGLNTYENPLLIGVNEAQSIQNVVLDKTGSIDKRDGSVQLNASAIGGGSSDVNAVYRLELSNGDKYCIAFSSTTGYYSSDACQTFTAFISTLTRNNDVNCDPFQDRLYCVNNQYNFYVNGTNDSAVVDADMPSNSQYLRVHRNRCFTAGSNANYSRLSYSDLSDCTSWTSTSWIDVAPQDGDIITCIGPPIFDMLPIYKKFSTWVLRGVDNNTFQLINVSKEIGAKDCRTVKNLFNVQLFDSLGPNGGQPGVYGLDGISIKEVSKKIRNEFDLVDTFKTVTNRKVLDTKADFDAGTFSPLVMSMSRNPGLIQSSYTSLTDQTTAHWAAFSSSFVITNNDTAGKLTMLRSTFSSTNGSFSNGTWSGWTGTWPTNAPTTLSDGKIYSSCPNLDPSGYIGCSDDILNVTRSTITISILSSSDAVLASCKVLSNPSGSGSNETTCDYVNYDAGMAPLSGTSWASWIATFTVPSVYTNQDIKLRIQDEQTGVYAITASAFPAGKFVSVRHTFSGQLFPCFSSCGVANYDTVSPSTFTSQVFDTAISSPVWGPFTVSMTTNSTITATFKTQVATSTAGVWDSLSGNITNGLKITSAGKRYIRYEASLATSSGTQTPTITSVNLTAASTGTWTSAETFLSNNISAGGFGLFQVVQNTNGNASIAYAIRVSSVSGGTANQPFTAITSGDTITLSTGAYFQVMSTYTITSATETCNTDSIVANWNDGTQTRSPSAEVYQNRYHISVQSLNGSINDRIYVLNSNGAWTKFTGINARYLSIVNQNLIAGGSTTTSAGFIYQLYNGDSDDGASINASYQTKDFAFGNIWTTKAITRVFLVGSNDPTTISLDLIANTGMKTNTYNINLSTGMAYKISNIPVEGPINGQVFSLKAYNNAASAPWSVHGLGMRRIKVGTEQP